MASTIAALTKTADGFKGTLTTLTLKAPIEIQKNARKANEREPDYRVVAGNGFEVGAGWVRQAKLSGEEYVSISLSAPEFNGVMYGNIAPAPGGNAARGAHLPQPSPGLLPRRSRPRPR